jgi:nicotinamide mononucleotide transporter
MEGLSDFIQSMGGESTVEVIAALLGLANIALLVRRSVWNYPFGLAMVSLYGWIFVDARLYSDAGLQVFFFVIQLWGWMNWLRARDAQGLVIVERLGLRRGLAFAGAAALGAGTLGFAMERLTDAAAPYWDASIASLSIAAQILMAQRRLENWIVWILVDILAIGLFWSRGLYPTAALYAVFLAMSVIGFVSWLSAWRAGRAVA